MPPTQDVAEFRRELADNVIAELSTDLARVSPHFGERYANADVPAARAMRQRGGSFEWVAFGFDPHPMWDAHVGVLTEDGRVTVGLHVHERLSPTRPAAVDAIADDVNAEYQFSDAAAEHQFNRPSLSISSVDVDDLAEDVATLCRRFEPVVDELVTEASER